MKMIKLLVYACLIVFYLPAHAQSNSGAAKDLDMVKVISTGPEYNLVTPLLGGWNVEQKIWNDSSATPVATAHFVADRTLLEHFLEEVMEPLPGSKEKPFKRITYLNFNYANYRWEYIVLDTRYPVMMFETSVGNETDNGKLNLYLSSFVLPPGWIDEHGGQLAKQRRVISFENKDKTVMQQYWTIPGGKEFLAIQYTYTRKK